MSKKTILQNNPLFREVEEEQPIKATSQKPEPDYRHASFIMRTSAYQFVRDYAYTQRIPIKDAISDIVDYFAAEYKKLNKELLSEPKRND